MTKAHRRYAALACLVALLASSAGADEPAIDETQLLVAAHKGQRLEFDPKSPPDFLYQVADKALIRDEPLTVTVPKGLNDLVEGVNVPATNPLTKGKYNLGQQLYFDPRLSLDNTVSCATCHNPAKGWSDDQPVAVGILGQKGARNSPTVINTAYGRTMFWDGRAPDLEAQSQGPILNPIEMAGHDVEIHDQSGQTLEAIVTRLRKVPGYVDQFKATFGTNVTLDGIAKAISTFERVAALSGNSPYDRYTFGELEALDESQKRGMILFGLSLRGDDEAEIDVIRQKARCSVCHVGANFTDEKFHNLGVGWDAATKSYKDLGRWSAVPIGAKSDADIAAFKTPTLRDAARTGPYMHDGSEATLEKVVELYDRGGNPNPFLDREMRPLKLTDQEKADLVAFMKALTGETIPLEQLLPKLPPGPDGTAPDPKKALDTPAGTTAAAGAR